MNKFSKSGSKPVAKVRSSITGMNEIKEKLASVIQGGSRITETTFACINVFAMATLLDLVTTNQ